RRIIKAAAPDAVETISYGMPTFRLRGRQLAHIAAWKSHCALYGANPAGHEDDLAAYDTSKGTIRFPTGQPLPEALITALIGARKAEIEAASAAPPRKKPRTRSSS
ncbi:MAG TPA: DUF1801 domain-containing protein, partial [Chloroflexota bacterium]|nr:DUF1801 domain-containing protein [Chloroflexota bacterium]